MGQVSSPPPNTHGAAPWRNDAAVSPLTQSLFKGKLGFEAVDLRCLLLGTTRGGMGRVESNHSKTVELHGRENLFLFPIFLHFLSGVCGWLVPCDCRGPGTGSIQQASLPDASVQIVEHVAMALPCCLGHGTGPTIWSGAG